MIGVKFIIADNFLWRHHFKTLLPLTPPFIEPKIDCRKAKKLIKKNKAYFIRWESNFDNGKPSNWWHIIKDSSEDLMALSRNTRNQIRRGSKHFNVHLCDQDFIAQNTYSIYRDTFNSYSTFEKILSEEEFKDQIINLPSFTEFWVIKNIESHEIVGFSENIVLDDSCFYNTIWILPGARKKYAGYLLFHIMNKYYLNEKGLKYVSDGTRSISHHTNIHEFLQSKFGFRKAYCELNVVYSWNIWLLVILMYPFKNLINKLSFLNKASVLLKQEKIRRSFEK